MPSSVWTGRKAIAALASPSAAVVATSRATSGLPWRAARMRRRLGGAVLGVLLAFVSLLAHCLGAAAADARIDRLRALTEEIGYAKSLVDFPSSLLSNLRSDQMRATVPPRVLEAAQAAALELDGERTLAVFLERVEPRIDDATLAEAEAVMADPVMRRLYDRVRTFDASPEADSRSASALARLREEAPERVDLIDRVLDATEFDDLMSALGEATIYAMTTAATAEAPAELRPTDEQIRALARDAASSFVEESRAVTVAAYASIFEGFSDDEINHMITLGETPSMRAATRAFVVSFGEAIIDTASRFGTATVAFLRDRDL